MYLSRIVSLFKVYNFLLDYSQIFKLLLKVFKREKRVQNRVGIDD